VRHYLAIWDSYGVPQERFRSDAGARVQAFLEEGRRKRKLRAFVAEEGGEAIGSAACQLHLVPFPVVLKPEHWLHGYVFHVWVEPEFRRRGIARALTARCVDYLRDIGCTTAVLHASDAGEPLYISMGFGLATEMRKKLRD
jgi:ribosomal protein S18 acetylase RimI-like enzyme